MISVSQNDLPHLLKADRVNTEDTASQCEPLEQADWESTSDKN